MASENIQMCVGVVAAASGLSDAQSRELLDRLDGRAERLQREKGLTPGQAVAQALKDAVRDEEAAASIQKRNQLLNLAKRVDRRARIDEAARQIGSEAQPNLGKAVENQIVAIATPVRGGRLSAEAVWKTRSAEYAGEVVTKLRNAGLLSAVRNGSLGNAWARELYELSLQSAGDARANPGVTGNDAAQTIAKIFHDAQEKARGRLNREGAWISDYAGYITRTTHDADKIRRAGFNEWRAAIEPALDARTFDGVEDRGKFLNGVYNALITGVHLSDEGGVGFKDPAFTGPRNLARQASAERVLHFADADGWLGYQHRFGNGTLVDQMMAGFDRSARQEALLQRWGTNPRAELDADVQFLREKYRDVSPDAVNALTGSTARINNEFGLLDGSLNRPANRLLAQISSDIRTVESMSKLGLVVFTHLSAAVTKAAELRYQGVGFFERYANFFDSVFQGRGRGEQGELADLLLAGTEGMHGRLLARFSPDDTVPGTLSKLANRFFDATGLTWMLDAQKAGAERIMSRHLGGLIDRPFDELPPEVQRGLTQYDINPAHWDVLRGAPDHFTSDGRVFLTPDAATRALGETAESDRLALKLHAYFADVANRSIITPGIADRAFFQQGTLSGTPMGEALRFVSQFKLWGSAAIRQGLGREIYGGQGTAGAISGVVQMAIGAATFGYLTMYLKDTTKFLNPRPPNSPLTWEAALIQGGGFGILGDYLFGEYSRFGGGIGESVLGPVLGQGLTELMNVWNAAKDGRPADIPPELARIAVNNTPFVNLFYTRWALNYLFLHSLQETMNPGYLHRAEQQLRKRTGQTHWLSPESHLKTFGR